MKAVVFERHGGISVLKKADLPAPIPGRDEAVVQVKACSVNHLDIWVRQGLLGVQIPLPHILGCDVAGVVHALGRPHSSFKIGQSVVVAPGISCGHCAYCLAGRDSLCLSYKILGSQVDGGYAEFVKVPLCNLVPISVKKLDYVQWAAAPLVFLTAWHMLMTRGKLAPGETVLIHAAGSGIGSAAVQIAKWRGARVITTVGADAKVKKAKQLGADIVIQHKKKDFAKEILRLTHHRGVELVFEHIGPATWDGSIRVVAKGGRLVTCGATTGRQVGIDLRFFFSKELSVHGCYMGSRPELVQALHWIGRGVFKPVVDKVFPLSRAREAHGRMESRQNFGKIILVP